MDLKPGDVVILKSGGHPLSVVEVNDGKVACVWMGNEGDLFRETLPHWLCLNSPSTMTKRKRKTTKTTKKKTMTTKRKSTTRAPARKLERISASPGIHSPAASFLGIGPHAEDLIFAADRPRLSAVDSAESTMAVRR